MQIDALASPELRATIYTLKSIDKTLQKMVRVHTKRIAEPEWKQGLSQRAKTTLERRVLADTAVVSVSNQNVKVQSASKGRPLSGGLRPPVNYAAVEFGAHKGRKSTYTRRSPKGRSHKVTRDTRAGLRNFNGRGFVFYPTAANMIPRIASMWVQTTVKTVAKALEGEQE